MRLRPFYLCSHEAFALALGRIRIQSFESKKLHPMALEPRWVRL